MKYTELIRERDEYARKAEARTGVGTNVQLEGILYALLAIYYELRSQRIVD